MISVVINGKKREMEGPIDLPTFLASNQLDTRFLAVAHNGAILTKEEYALVVLKDGDALEIVRPVGGG